MKRYFILIIVATIFMNCIGCSKDKREIDTSTFSNQEIIAYLEEKGYIFEKHRFESSQNTIYVTLTNEVDKIRIQKIKGTYIGTMYTFQNANYNNEHANILIISRNDEDEKIQYSAYEKWLKSINLTDNQIISVLNYYDDNNIYKIINDLEYLN